jgi:hypothetical protein
MVVPLGRRSPRAHDAVLVLQRGENPSTDYYLRPRLAGASTPVVFADIDSPPGRCGLLDPGDAQSLFVVICRYITPHWLDALEAMSERLARVAFFMDDDLPEMMRDPALAAAARGKAALHFGAQVDRLGALCNEVWVSTAPLAARYPQARAVVLPPLPDEEPPKPSPESLRKTVYHATDTHARERRFVVDVARRLAAAGSDAPVEIVGDAEVRRACAGLSAVEVIPQTPWPEHRLRQKRSPAAICLAPLHPSPLNGARAAVKAFDAARLGAAGLYADCEPFRGFVRDGEDGLLLPMDAEAWAQAILNLLADPGRRLDLAQAASDRLSALLASDSGLPPAGGA